MCRFGSRVLVSIVSGVAIFCEKKKRQHGRRRTPGAGHRLTLLLCCFALTGTANASEGFIFGGPIGSAGMGAAYLPSTGLYGLLFFGSPNGSSIYGNNAKPIDGTNFGIHVWAVAPGLMYVYPFQLAGGSLATEILNPLYTVHLTVDNQPSHSTGVSDLYVNFLSWSKHFGGASSGEDSKSGELPYGLTVKLAYSMQFPTGKYDPSAPVSTGYNTTFFVPNAAISYLTGPSVLGDGTEFSLAVWYDIATKNQAHAYQTGDVIDFDWAISEHLGRWQVGVHGNYATQLQDDVVNGIPIGDRLGSAGIGPVISYAIPRWKAFVELSGTTPIWTRNYNHVVAVYCTFVKKFG